MKLDKIIAAFLIITGSCVSFMWAFLLSTGGIPELKTNPAGITLHMIADFTMALLLISGGVLLILRHKKRNSLYFLSSGMLIYSVVNSAGYYLKPGGSAFVLLFSIIASLSVMFLILKNIF
jgi:hypothetical protein